MNYNASLSRRSFVQKSIIGGAGLTALDGAAAAPLAAQNSISHSPEPDGPLRGEANTAADFIDRRWVEHTYFLTRRVCTAERFAGDPVIADAGGGPISVADRAAVVRSSEREDEGAARTLDSAERDPGWGSNPASAIGSVHRTKEGLVVWCVSPQPFKAKAEVSFSMND